MKNAVPAALLLTATLFAPLLFAQASSAPPATPAPPPIKFDVVSFKRCEAIDLVHKNTIRPVDGDFIGRHCQSIHALFDFAYGGGSPYQMKSQPDWVDTEAYDFQAKVAPQDVPTWHTMDLETRRLMVRAVLADLLKLKVHAETQSRPIYNLVVAKGGPKFTEHKPGPDDPPPGPDNLAVDLHWAGPDEAVYTNATMNNLVSALDARLDHKVVDQTGLTGKYDFHVKPLPITHYDAKSANVEETDFAAIIDGIKSLGLRLEPAKADISVLVIDHIERPAQN